MKKATLLFAVLAVIALTAGVFTFLRVRADLELISKIEPDIAAAEEFCAADHPVSENEEVVKALSQDYSKVPTDDKYVFVSPEGIVFHSNCDAWNEENLKDLYRELLRNRHGDEINTLEEVVVYPQADEFAAATHQQTTRTTEFKLHLPCMPSDRPLFRVYDSAGVITLYDGSTLTTAAQMASSLSHEYGHHYTFTYMFSDTHRSRDFYRTDYARLRGLTDKNSRTDTSDSEEYFKNHRDYLVEIAAEDYVVLMGSPASRDVSEYKDVREQANGEVSNPYLTRNANPQENMLLPMATDVPGLADYFYGFIGEEAPEPLPDRDFHITLTPYSASYDLVIGYTTYVNYTVEWDKLYGDDAVYTLISCGDDEDMYWAIRTVTGDEDASATIGAVAFDYGTGVNVYDDKLAQGTRTFIVTVILPDGRICVSEPLKYTF